MITPSQCRGARGLLGLSQAQTAKLAGVGRRVLAQFEGGSLTPKDTTIKRIVEALEREGVEFIDENGGGPGVRLRARKVE